MARIEESIEINVPPHTAYDQLTRFEQYPRFVEDVATVRRLDGSHLHLRTGSGEHNAEWDAEITQQVPDRCIAWRSTSGPGYEGKIELHPTDGDRTRLVVTVDCDPRLQLQPQVPGQSQDPQRLVAQHAAQDLERFKKFIEEFARDIGAWRGRPSEAATAPARGEAVGERTESAEAIAQSARQRKQAVHGEPAAARQRQPEPETGWIPRRPVLPAFLEIWEQPLGVVRRMSEDMDKLIGGFIRRAGPRGSAPHDGHWTPPVDIAQGRTGLVVCAELAGVRREDVQVDIRADRLTIAGERRPEAPHALQEYHRSERAYGRFCRVIALPAGADAEAASAHLRDGVLRITVPLKADAGAGRRIEVGAGE